MNFFGAFIFLLADAVAAVPSGRRSDATKAAALAEAAALLDKPKKSYMFARQIAKKPGSWEGLHMASDKQNLQDVFLNAVRKSKGNVTIFLVNGVKLSGVVTWFDNYCVLLRKDNLSQLIYKHAISTILPSQPVALFAENQDDG